MLRHLNERARAAIGAARAATRLERPDRLARNLLVTAAVGPTIAGAVAGAAARYPNGLAVIDGRRDLTYARLWRDGQRVARMLANRGIDESSTVGLLAHNSAEFVTGLLAASICGADVVLLNTGSAVPQLVDVAGREGCTHLVATARYRERCREAADELDGVEVVGIDAQQAPLGVPLVPSRRMAQLVILTSGTTGTPKGARRTTGSPTAALGFLERVPVRSGDTVVVACPLFHAWALTHLLLALSFASTVVVGDFDPGDIPGVVADVAADGLVVVPAMLQRVLRADGVGDSSSLRYIASSGSALSSSTVRAAQERFGDVLYNVYGSTEVALATIAGPADLRADPSTAGRVVPGVRVELIGDDGVAVPPGEPGRIFVDSGSAFEGYTGGGDKDRIGSLVATGDVGHFDGDLLIIDGRSDDMIVSGGENVFPSEVEDVITQMPGVVEAAVVGVPDDEFGQRLAAFVVAEGLTGDDIRERVRGRLARYKVPRDVTFVDALPRTTTGKVRRGELGS